MTVGLEYALLDAMVSIEAVKKPGDLKKNGQKFTAKQSYVHPPENPPGVWTVIFNQVLTRDILWGIYVLAHAKGNIALKSGFVGKRQPTYIRQVRVR